MIVGVDVSSKRIDLAWLENGKPCRWHQELPKGHLIDRLRAIEIKWPTGPGVRWGRYEDPQPEWDTEEIAVEMPFGQSRKSVAALMSVVGIVTRQAPPWARVAWPSSQELRAAIGARNNKTDAHNAIRWHMSDGVHQSTVEDWDEHELDALVACLGWTKILAQQEAA